MNIRLDEIDRRILYRLASDARNTSAPSIAEEVDVSAGTIRNRIDRLEEHGVIQGYHADVNYERTEELLTHLFLCHADVDDRERIANQAFDIPGVVNVREILTGRENLHVLAVGEDTHDITRIARELTGLGVTVEDEGMVQSEQFHPYHPFGPGERDGSAVADLMSVAGGSEVAEFTVGAEAPIAGRTLAAANEEGLLDEDVVVVSIERDEEVVTPQGETRIRAGDLVTVFSRRGVSDDVLRACSGDGPASGE